MTLASRATHQMLGDYAEGFRSEHRFYERFAELAVDAGVRIPAAYCTRLLDSPSEGACCFVCCNRRPALRHCLLLEDLGAGYHCHDPFAAVSEAHAAAALRNVAHLHGRTWGRTEELGLGGEVGEWMRFNFGLPPGPVSFREMRKFSEATVCGLEAEPARSRLAADGITALGGGGERTIAALRSLAAAWREGRGSGDVPPWARPTDAQCATHGDFHQWNNLFARDDPTTCILLDWQQFSAGRAALEVVFFLNLSVDPEAACDGRLLRAYHAELASAGGRIEWHEFLSEADCAMTNVAVLVARQLVNPVAGWRRRRIFAAADAATPSSRAAAAKIRDAEKGSLAVADRALRRACDVHERNPRFSFDTGAPYPPNPLDPLASVHVAPAVMAS